MEDLLKIWQDKKIFLEKEYAITADANQKFDLSMRIKECDQEIARLEKEIARLQSQPKPNTKTPMSPEPPGNPYTLEWYINRKEEEARAIDKLRYNSSSVAICGPRRFGKSTFLENLLERVIKDKPQNNLPIRVEMTKFYKAHISSLDDVLKELADILVNSVKGKTDWISTSWVSDNPTTNVEKLMENYIFPRAKDELLFLVIEKTDMAETWKAKEAFFGMLRSWLEKPHDPWQKLRLILTLSIPPSELIPDHNQSPFSNCEIIRLKDFDQDQMQNLVGKYRLDWSETQIKQIMGLVGGHPVLVRTIMYQAKKFDKKLEDLLDPHHPIFEDHLEMFESILNKDKALQKELELFKNGVIRAASNSDTCKQLLNLGLLKKVRNKYCLSYPIYEKLIG